MIDHADPAVVADLGGVGDHTLTLAQWITIVGHLVCATGEGVDGDRLGVEVGGQVRRGPELLDESTEIVGGAVTEGVLLQLGVVATRARARPVLELPDGHRIASGAGAFEERHHAALADVRPGATVQAVGAPRADRKVGTVATVVAFAVVMEHAGLGRVYALGLG